MPTTIEMKPHNPTAMIGNTQPRRQMLTMNKPAAAIEMTMSSRSAGRCAWTSVYVAPSTKPFRDFVSANCAR